MKEVITILQLTQKGAVITHFMKGIICVLVKFIQAKIIEHLKQNIPKISTLLHTVDKKYAEYTYWNVAVKMGK